ncbi:conserved hypothetical protein [Neospora caninum Liverpool]|uniref:HEAT repeat-containing protein n=1 Tax=Neospora caninum (strain Liverpool) TaxID=572307 RepID=F0VC85_NEOCL|nr:conserved hypothetical protein [Neospora caninum Liverpool]CBZ51219.1 conserved hypothetical protein [Neospora caninum Liverpool]CEL68533.1 TPA: HEAT repeat-containing protein [Neospora caninum Liverpool]|eukprot:XP_003881252.1 conserved hypothetical protein [Neospora caninum Liverpool]
MAGQEAQSASSTAPGAPPESSRDQVPSSAPPGPGFPQILPVPQVAAPASAARCHASPQGQPSRGESVSRGGSSATAPGNSEASAFPTTGNRTRGSVTASGIKVLSLPEPGRAQKQTVSRPDLLSRRPHQYVDIRELRKTVPHEPGPLILPPPAQVGGGPVPGAVPTWPGVHLDAALLGQKSKSEGLTTGFVFPSELTPSTSSLVATPVAFVPPSFSLATGVSGLAATASSLRWTASVGVSSGGRVHQALPAFAAPPGSAGYPLSHARMPGGGLVYFLTSGVNESALDGTLIDAGTRLPLGSASPSHATGGTRGEAFPPNAGIRAHRTLLGTGRQQEENGAEGALSEENMADGGTNEGEECRGADGATESGQAPVPVVPRLIAHVALMQQLMPSLLDDRPAHQLQSVEALNALLRHSKKTLLQWLGRGAFLSAASSPSRCASRSSTDTLGSSGMQTLSPVSFSGGSLPPPGLDCLFMSVRVSLLHLIAGDLLTSAEVADRCAAARCLSLVAELAAVGAVCTGPATLAALLTQNKSGRRNRKRLASEAAKSPAVVLDVASRAREEIAAQAKQGKSFPKREGSGCGRGSFPGVVEAGGVRWTEAELEACEGASTVVRCCLVLLAHMTADGSTVGRLAALAALTSLVPYMSQEMALASLQRPSFPPTTSSPLARLRILLHTDLAAATERATLAAKTAYQKLLGTSPTRVSASSLRLAVAGVLAGEGESAHRARHTVAGQELQAEISQLPLPVGWLLLSLDDSDFRVRQAAFVLLLRLLESYTQAGAVTESERKSQPRSDAFPQAVQLLIWDYLSDQRQTVQAAAAAILPPLSLTIPLRDGAFRRAIFPLLHAKKKSTRMIFLRTLPLCQTLNARGRKVEVQGLLRCPYSREDEHEIAACVAEVVFAAYHGLWDKIAQREETGGRDGDGTRRNLTEKTREEEREKEEEMLHVFRILAPPSLRKRTELALATNWGRRAWELRLLPLMRRDTLFGLRQKRGQDEAQNSALASPAGRRTSPEEGEQGDATNEGGRTKANVGPERKVFLSPSLLLKKQREAEDNRLVRVLPLDVQLSMPETSLQFSLALQHVLPTDSIERQLAAADCLLSHLEDEEERPERDALSQQPGRRLDSGCSPNLVLGDADAGAKIRGQAADPGTPIPPPPALQRRDSDMSVESGEETKKCSLQDGPLGLRLEAFLPRRLEKRFPRPATQKRSFSRLFGEREDPGSPPAAAFSLLDRTLSRRARASGATKQDLSSSVPTLLNSELWRLLHSEIPCRAGTCRQAMRSMRPVLALPHSFPFSPLVRGPKASSQSASGALAASRPVESLFSLASFEDEEERLFRFVERRAATRKKGGRAGPGRSPGSGEKSWNAKAKNQASCPKTKAASGPSDGDDRETDCDRPTRLPLLPSTSLSDVLVLAVLERERGRARATQRAKREGESHDEEAESARKRLGATTVPDSPIQDGTVLGKPAAKRPRLSLFSFSSLNASKSASKTAPTSNGKESLFAGPSPPAPSFLSSPRPASSGVHDGQEGSLAVKRESSQLAVSVRRRPGASLCLPSAAAPVRAQLTIRASTWASKDDAARARKRSLSPACFSFLLGGQQKRREREASFGGLLAENGEREEPGVWGAEDESSWRSLLNRGDESETATEPLTRTLELRPPAWSCLIRMLCREAFLRERSLLFFALSRFRSKQRRASHLPSERKDSSAALAPVSRTGALSLSSLARMYVRARKAGASPASLAASLPRSFCVWRNVLVSSRLQAIAATALLASPSLFISPPDLLPHSRLLGLLSRASFLRDFTCPEGLQGDSRLAGRLPRAWEAHGAPSGHSRVTTETRAASSLAISLSSLSFPFAVSLACPNWEIALEAYMHQSVIASTGLAALLPVEGRDPPPREGRSLRSSCVFSPFYDSSGKLALGAGLAGSDMSRLLVAEALASLVPRPLRFSCSKGAVVWLEATVDLFSLGEASGGASVAEASHARRLAAPERERGGDADTGDSRTNSQLGAQVRGVCCLQSGRTAGRGLEGKRGGLWELSGEARTADASRAREGPGARKSSRDLELVLCVRGPTPLEVTARTGQSVSDEESEGFQVRVSSAGSSPSLACRPASHAVETASCAGKSEGARDRAKTTGTRGSGEANSFAPFPRQPPSLLVRAVLAGTSRNTLSPFCRFNPEDKRSSRARFGPGLAETWSGGWTLPGGGVVELWSRCGGREKRCEGSSLATCLLKQKHEARGAFSPERRYAQPISRNPPGQTGTASLGSCAARASASECIGSPRPSRKRTSWLDSSGSDDWKVSYIRKRPRRFSISPASSAVVPLFAPGAELAFNRRAGGLQWIRERKAAVSRRRQQCMDLVVCALCPTRRFERRSEPQRETSSSMSCARGAFTTIDERMRRDAKVLVSVSDAKRIWLQPEWI